MKEKDKRKEKWEEHAKDRYDYGGYTRKQVKERRKYLKDKLGCKNCEQLQAKNKELNKRAEHCSKAVEELKKSEEHFILLSYKRLDKIQKMKIDIQKNFNIYAKECNSNVKLREQIKFLKDAMKELFKELELHQRVGMTTNIYYELTLQEYRNIKKKDLRGK